MLSCIKSKYIHIFCPPIAPWNQAKFPRCVHTFHNLVFPAFPFLTILSLSQGTCSHLQSREFSLVPQAYYCWLPPDFPTCSFLQETLLPRLSSGIALTLPWGHPKVLVMPPPLCFYSFLSFALIFSTCRWYLSVFYWNPTARLGLLCSCIPSTEYLIWGSADINNYLLNKMRKLMNSLLSGSSKITIYMKLYFSSYLETSDLSEKCPLSD